MTTFNNEAALGAFPKFQILDDRIKSIILQMLKDDRLNGYGGLKRPPNAWLIFRSDMLATNLEMSTMSQAEVTVLCKSRWAVATLEERMELHARAQRAHDELIQYFPDYSYRPMSTVEKERWKRLAVHQRKDFWLSSAVRIAKRIANPHEPWDGLLTLEQWANLGDTPAGSQSILKNPPLADFDSPGETESTSDSTPPPRMHLGPRSKRARNPARSPIDASGSKTDQSSATSARFHPYSKNMSTYGSSVGGQGKSQARIRRKSTNRHLPPAPLRDVLVHIGPQSSINQRRRLVLSMFQLKNKAVWVSEVVDDDVPDDVFEHLLGPVNPDETSPDHFVLRDYTDPWIPEAMDKDGEIFYPKIESVSDYHGYMAAYCFAKESSSGFIWPPPSSLSPPSLHEAPAASTISLVQSTELAPLNSDSQNSKPLVDPYLNPNMGTPEICEPLPSTNLISDSDSDSVTTPEEDLGWDEQIIDIGGFSHGELEDSEFEFE